MKVTDMEENIVLVDMQGSKAAVTLNRPEVHNAFDENVIARLAAVFDDIAGREEIKAVVLSGNGKSFSAGADLNWMRRAASYTEEQNRADAMALAAMLYKLYTLPKVTIACVQGAALGGGFGLVSCCDIVIADHNAVFGLSEVKLGLIPATIAPYVLRAIGERQARRYFQTGERFTGARAFDLGLVHELAQTPEEMDELLQALLDNLRSNGPQAMAASKRLCLDLAGRDISTATLEDTSRRIAEIRAGAEAREGLSAFLEKRPAKWR